MKRFFAPLMLSSLLVLAACSDTPPEVTPTPEAAGFRFDIDPGSEQVSVTAVGMGALSTQQAGEARLLEPGAELVSRLQSTNFRPGNVLDIRATFENVTDDESFRQPFTFRPALTPEQGNYLSSSEPEVSDAALGGDGVLSPGETTSVLSFRVEHKGERFSYFVNAYAVVEETEGACGDTGVFNGDVTIRTQEDIDALRGCRVIDGDLIIRTDASTLDFSPLDGLQTITQDFVIRQNLSLTSVSGFGALSRVGGVLSIFLNEALTSVPSFPQLRRVVDGIFIDDNTSLASLTGFGALESVFGGFSVSNNASLTSITGFGALESAGDFSIFNNNALLSFSGFGQLKEVGTGGRIGGSFRVSGNESLTSFSGFEQLSKVGSGILGGFEISDNPSLVSIPAFNALTNVGGSSGPFTPTFFISNNDALPSISGFESLAVVEPNVDVSLSISDNDALVSIAGFDSLSSDGFRGGMSRINDNDIFDCTVPPQSNLPFLPVDESTGNLVNCPTGNGGGSEIEDDVTIRTQADLDALEGVTKIGGSLVVSTDAASLDFSPLDELQTVTRNFNISDNGALLTISGFDRLETVGGAFVISQNPALTSVPEFGQLNGTGLRLDISDNASLTSISGFGQLEVVGFNRDFNALDEAGFRITNNASLTSISGFGQLDIVFTVLVINANASLTSISGFSDFSVEDGIAIINNSSFDCSVAPQENLPFLPLDGGTDSSFGNLVDCPIE